MHPKLPSPLFYPASANNAKEALASLTHSLAADGKTVVYQLELTHRPDNRLTPPMVDTAVCSSDFHHQACVLILNTP